MKNKKLLYGILAITIAIMGIGLFVYLTKPKKVSQLPNPASVYCLKQGGKWEIRKDKEGNESGFCLFEDGSECEEWKFFRGECKKGEIIKPTDLSQVKVASQYRRVTDGIALGRGLDEVADILKETKTDFIFEGWIRQNPCPNSCSDLPIDKRKNCEMTGYSYEHLGSAILKIKQEEPNIIFGGGLFLEFLNPECWNEQTGEKFGKDETWAMALDPSKWGIKDSKGKLITKTQYQCAWAAEHKWIDIKTCNDPKSQLDYYFPDVTNPDFQELFLSWAKKQIDSGVNLIWIDMFFTASGDLQELTDDVNHPAVKESYDASSKIVDEIHKYGDSKGKTIYVISWPQSVLFPFSQPKLDGVMLTFSPKEVRSGIDESYWDTTISEIKGKLGDIPIFVRLDYGQTGSPLYVFSQELTIPQANEFLKTADDFTIKKGMIFIYPVHGGNMCHPKSSTGCKKLSYGQYDWYDSLAPEFQTYETIKELAQKKAGKETGEVKVETICTDGIDNDGDGLVDNEDGDCWIKEGGILDEDYGMVLKYRECIDLLPRLKETGIKSIELFPIWENAGIGWMVRDFSKLDPTKGSEADLNKFINEAHKLGIKVIVQIENCVTVTPNKVCKDVRTGKSYYDPEGIGGAVYLYQMAHPSKKILIKDVNGNFVCFPFGFGYSIDRSSQDVIDFFSDIFKNQIIARGFDGIYIGGGIDNYYKGDEKIWRECDSWSPPQVVSEDHPPFPLFKALDSIKKPEQIITSEHISTKEAKTKICDYPFYQPNSDLDEAMGISDDYSLMHVLRTHVLDNKLTSSEFVDWINNRPISYNKLRYNAYRNSEIRSKEDYQFILNDKRYPPLVTLISTLPGVPKVTYFEFQNQRDVWKTVLPIRNNNDALKYGSIENVWKSGDNTYAYSRTYENENIIMVINFNNKQATSILNIPLNKGNMLKDELSGETFTVTDPTNFGISIPAYGSRILTLK